MGFGIAFRICLQRSWLALGKHENMRLKKLLAKIAG